jgi:hypothetical protein
MAVKVSGVPGHCSGGAVMLTVGVTGETKVIRTELEGVSRPQNPEVTNRRKYVLVLTVGV